MPIKPAANVIWRIVQNEALFLDTQSGNYLSLNPTGTKIWELLVAGKSEAEIAHLLSDEYAVPIAAVEEDIQNLIEELKAESLISLA